MSYVNLLPEDYLARQAQKRANRLCAAMFALVVAVILGAALLAEVGHARTREVNERVTQNYQEAGKLIQQMQQLEVAKNEMVGKAKLTAGLLERVPRSYLLATVTNALPEGCSLTKFEMGARRKQVTVITANGKGSPKQVSSTSGPMETNITVTGLAGTDLEVGRFIAAMARSPLMETVDLVYSQEKKVDAFMVREFQVILSLKTNADVHEGPAGNGKKADLALAGPAAGGER